jgi:hypothetical protein
MVKSMKLINNIFEQYKNIIDDHQIYMLNKKDLCYPHDTL